MKRLLFLKWAWLMSMVFVTMLIGAQIDVYKGMNVFDFIYNNDQSMLSSVIFVLFIATSIKCGILTWRAGDIIEEYDLYTKELADIDNHVDNGWFVADRCEQLGLIGTVLGFIYMLFGGFAGFEGADPNAVKMLLSKISAGMAMAFLTTLVGIVSSLLLSIQYQNLGNAIERVKQ